MKNYNICMMELNCNMINIGLIGKAIGMNLKYLLEAYIDGEYGEIPYAKREAIGRTVDYAMARHRYIGHFAINGIIVFRFIRCDL